MHQIQIPNQTVWEFGFGFGYLSLALGIEFGFRLGFGYLSLALGIEFGFRLGFGCKLSSQTNGRLQALTLPCFYCAGFVVLIFSLWLLHREIYF